MPVDRFTKRRKKHLMKRRNGSRASCGLLARVAVFAAVALPASTVVIHKGGAVPAYVAVIMTVGQAGPNETDMKPSKDVPLPSSMKDSPEAPAHPVLDRPGTQYKPESARL